MTEPLLAPSFLFRVATACRFRDVAWTGGPLNLPDECRLLHFGALDGGRTFADVRVAWSDAGLAIGLRVEGKRQPPWCREARPNESDGLSVWIDTRDTHNIHRASRYCHRFVFLPSGGGRALADPVAEQLLVDRARENARPVPPGVLKSRGEKRSDGYVLEAYIPAESLTGFNPVDYPRLGFMYAVADRELGIQTFASGLEFPFDADPSLWGTLELVR